MSTSTWNNITTGLNAAVYDSYTAKSSRQRRKREVVDVMTDVDGFCQRKRHELEGDTYRIQALADGLGLIVYSTGAQKICKYLDTKSRTDIPLRDMKIVHDWSGFYYDGTVYTDAEEEEMIRKQFNIPKSA